MPNKFNNQRFTLIDGQGNTYVVDCWSTRTQTRTTEHAYCGGHEGKSFWYQRPYQSFDYENALYDLAKRMSGSDKDKLKALNACIEARAKSEKDACEAWLNAFKKDYDNLSDWTKKHLADSGVEVTSIEQANELMRVSKAFDAMHKLLDGKEGE